MGNLIFVLVAVLVVLADQLTKLWVSSILSPGQTLWHFGFFSITLAENTGAAFSLFQGAFLPLVIVRFIGIIAILTIVILWNRRIRDWGGNWLMAALGLLLAGSIGNLADQLRLRYVVDFCYTGFWPTFNIADSSVVVAMFIIAFLVILPRHPRKQNK